MRLMERLTERYRNNDNTGISKGSLIDRPGKGYPSSHALQITTKLADYEDAEEQGLLLRLLCKVGDTVYYPVKDFKYVYPVKIEQIIISNLGDGRFCTQYNGIFYDGNGDPDQEFEFDEDDFEKNVFLSQAEAEQALADKGV